MTKYFVKYEWHFNHFRAEIEIFERKSLHSIIFFFVIKFTYKFSLQDAANG